MVFRRAHDRQDWGHHKRSRGVKAATQDWLGFFNDDDMYLPHYLASMLDVAETQPVDAVYCAWNEQPNCDFALTHSTAGNFIVRSELAKKAGYPDTAYYENDGNFIERLKQHGAVAAKVDEILYHHNAF